MSFEVTPQMLRQIAGAPVNKKVAEGLAAALNTHMEKNGINTKLRVAHFLAQLGHESDHFRTTREYASGAAYEGRRDLGNIRAGDGKRFRGRGPIQITGRYNYEKYGKKLGIDLVSKPELAETPDVGVRIAILYWNDHGLSELADKDDVKRITKKINGGYNGLNSRIAMLENAKRVLKPMKVAEVDLDLIDPRYIPKDFA